MIAGLDASAKMQGSGATVGNDEKKKAEAAKHPGYSDEEFAEYEKAVILAAAQGVKL